MRTIHFAVLAALASTASAAPAFADDVIHVTPPLYREQARTAAPRRAAELVTVPHVVAPAPAAPRVVTQASAVPLR